MSQNGFIFPNFRGENKKYLSYHHLVSGFQTSMGEISHRPQKNQNARLQRLHRNGKRYGKVTWTMENSDHLKMYLLLFFGTFSMIFPARLEFSGSFQGVFMLRLFKKSPIPSVPTLWFLRISGLHPCHPWHRITCWWHYLRHRYHWPQSCHKHGILGPKSSSNEAKPRKMPWKDTKRKPETKSHRFSPKKWMVFERPPGSRDHFIFV